MNTSRHNQVLIQKKLNTTPCLKNCISGTCDTGSTLVLLKEAERNECPTLTGK